MGNSVGYEGIGDDSFPPEVGDIFTRVHALRVFTESCSFMGSMVDDTVALGECIDQHAHAKCKKN